MRISIVVPFYNEERHIERCIEALLAQDYPSDAFEIILVDNNSTDRSAEIVERYDRVRLLREPIQGDYASRNRGVREASGEIIAFTDSDTAPRPDWLTAIARTMSDPTVGAIVGRIEFAPTRLLSMMEAYEAAKSTFIFSSDVPEIYFGYTCNMAVRKSLFDSLGLFAPVQRNSDVVFVRKAVDTCSTDVAVYGADVHVLRLEVPSFRAYLKKQRVYGRDFPRYASASAARPLSSRERWQVYRRAVAEEEYSPWQAALLLCLLAIGALSYDGARWLRTADPRSRTDRLEAGPGSG
jgi:glycosyltransferase involved in cell wall biosynthesis